ncbi:MAG: hypothetical protein JW753_11450 [Dehalococcoidia bacterium]|nr:hypothetical protein [Dehalococcoidia bacterium]
MKKETYLVHLDILGFEQLAEEVACAKGMDSNKVRSDFLKVAEDKIDALERAGRIAAKNHGERDDWILVIDSLEGVFLSVFEMLDHRTGYHGYDTVPLEIVIGAGDYDNWAKPAGRDLITERSTIRSVKESSHQLHLYHEYYRKKQGGQSPNSTFVVITESVYERLEPLDKRICGEIDCREGVDVGRKWPSRFFVADLEAVRRRGKVLSFLEKLGIPENKRYDRIADVYIPPLEFDAIREMLKRKRIVFITGTPEYGKTYTAVRLLWEYHSRGYQAKWVRGREKSERAVVRAGMENIQAELKPGQIVYFEDPFGPSDYEESERLERDIGMLVQGVEAIEDAYVVITSREEVFKEFERRKLSKVELRAFESTLSIRRPSYGPEERKEMLRLWAEKEGCKWLADDFLREAVLKSATYSRVLPTPLSIRAFVLATVGIGDADLVWKELREKSEETERVFADEIGEMSDDKVILLCFPLVGDFPVEVVRKGYENVAKLMNAKTAWDFNRVLDWFVNDKLEIRGSRRTLVFSHPSYREALRQFLFETGSLARTGNEVLRNVLSTLTSEGGEVASDVAVFVGSNFGRLDGDTRKLLFQLHGKGEPDIDAGICLAVAMGFKDLPEEVRAMLFETQRRGGESAVWAAYAVVVFYEGVPEEVRRILFEVCESAGAKSPYPVVRALAERFPSLPVEAQNLLLKLADKEENSWAVADAVAESFDKLPKNVQDLLSKLADRGERSREGVARAVAANFDKLPKGVQDLLFKVAKSDMGDIVVARAVAANFDKLPKDAQDLLFKMAEDENDGWVVAVVVVENFGKLPKDVQDLLFKMAEDEKKAWAVAGAVAESFDKLPKRDVENLLLKLANMRERDGVGAARGVAAAVARNFGKLSEDVQDLLFKMAEDEERARAVAFAVVENLGKVPKDVQDLLFKMAEDEKGARAVASAVASCFDKLPKDVQDLLFKMAEDEKRAPAVAFAVAEKYHEVPKDVQDLLFGLANKGLVSRASVAFAVAGNFDKLPKDVQDLLFKLADMADTASAVVAGVRASWDKLCDDSKRRLASLLPDAPKVGPYPPET